MGWDMDASIPVVRWAAGLKEHPLKFSVCCVLGRRCGSGDKAEVIASYTRESDVNKNNMPSVNLILSIVWGRHACVFVSLGVYGRGRVQVWPRPDFAFHGPLRFAQQLTV